MTLDPEEMELLESFERGEWKPSAGEELTRMRALARHRLHADVQTGFDALARGEGRTYEPASGQHLVEQVKRGRSARLKKA